MDNQNYIADYTIGNKIGLAKANSLEAKSATPGFFGKLKKGFTLIELLVVMSVMAILAGIVIPTVLSSRKAAKKVGIKNTLSQLSGAVDMYCLDKGTYPPTNPASKLEENYRLVDALDGFESKVGELPRDSPPYFDFGIIYVRHPNTGIILERKGEYVEQIDSKGDKLNFLDAYKKPFRYLSPGLGPEGSKEDRSFWSTGPDKVDQTAKMIDKAEGYRGDDIWN